MTTATRLLTLLMIATYLGFFLVEAILWTTPLVNGLLLPQLNPMLPIPAAAQVETLRNLFLNQGAYNLLLALGGVQGMRLWRRGDVHAGQVLLSFLCLFAIGAGITLLSTTHAYALGLLQLAVPVILLPMIRRDARVRG